jgi:hypothetical protein
MGIDPGLVRKTDDAFQDFVAFIHSLRPTDEETGRFYHSVSALSHATKINYITLRKAFDDDEQTLMAWSCRNLLELVIFTKFVFRSKANADEFAADRLIDGREIGIYLKKLEIHLNPKLTVSAFDSVIERFTKQMIDEGITRAKYHKAREVATQVGMLEEHETMNKVCSKFVTRQRGLFSLRILVRSDFLRLATSSTGVERSILRPSLRKWLPTSGNGDSGTSRKPGRAKFGDISIKGTAKEHELKLQEAAVPTSRGRSSGSCR